MSRCFIFAAGSFYGLRERPQSGDYVIAADAGYRTCQAIGLVPDLLIGDFDSMEQPEDFLHVQRIPVEKDYTDAMMAAKVGLERGCRTFYLYGGTGGKRLDHTLANFQLLMYLQQQGAKGNLYDDDFVYTTVSRGTLTIPKTVEWGLVSVFCLGEEAHGITEEGMQYTLHDASLSVTRPIGISNHFQAPQARITVREGTLIVGWELPPAERSSAIL